jgi:hypothetical protein
MQISERILDRDARTEPAPYVVAAESEQLAHAVLGLVEFRDSFSLCGEPAEVLTQVPGMAWHEVQPEYRCEHCQARFSPSP